jgi:Holliday junction resolvasome RuvABC endonuclease subunit
MLLAIDGSTVCTGFAFGGERDGSPKGGIWKLPGGDDLNMDCTLGSLAKQIRMFATFVNAKHICIEAPILKVDRYHSAASAKALIQLTGAMRGAAWEASARIHLYTVEEVREYFTGQKYLPGPEGKLAVQRRCQKLGWTYQNDDEADAKAVWAYGMSLNFPLWSPRMGIMKERAPA